MAKTGPDGAVWVLDWYNYLNLHNPAQPLGEGGAWINHLREKSRVRIWRVTPADGSAEPILDLSHATEDQLLAAFGNANLHWRLQAQRLLLAKGWSAALGDRLRDILENDRSVDPLGNNPRVVHALWTLHGLGRLAADTATWNPIVGDLLRHPAWGVRRNALLALPRTAASARILGAHCSVNDPHGHVRLQALAALAEIPDRPAGLPAMWDRYRDVDSHSALLADSLRLAEAATLPCDPDLHAPSALGEAVPPRSVGQASLPRNVLRFAAGRTGFRLLPHGGLPSGELRVCDLRGRIAFRSTYHAGVGAGMGRWSVPEARGLGQAAYIYAFAGADGSLLRGRLASPGGL